MAVDFSRYLNVEVESIKPPEPLPVGHYFATIKGWKGAERDYDKANGGPKTPVVEITFTISGADEDIDPSELPEGGGVGRIVSRDYNLKEDSGLNALRKLGEETCGLDVKGLHLSDMLPQLIKQPVKLYVEQNMRGDDVFPKVTKVLPAE